MSNVNFQTDKQTLTDLSVFDVSGQKSITGLFTPVTFGGGALLARMIKRPLNDPQIIRERLTAIETLQRSSEKLKLNKQDVDFIEYYLASGYAPKKFSLVKALATAVKYRWSNSGSYYITARGTTLLVKLLNAVYQYLQVFIESGSMLIARYYENYNAVFDKPGFELIGKLNGKERLSALKIERCNHLFRGSLKNEVRQLIDIVYELDAFNAVAGKAAQLNFCYPVIVEETDLRLEFSGVFHPLVANAVGSDISFSVNANLCFVTGANMAGKSTLLKSIGIAVLLAHVGFPVPALGMTTTLFSGLFTTINLSDNINAGYSHYYAEVRRVKEIAVKIGELKKVVVIFDELFRGTNVKDALEASVQIIKALAPIKNCVFIISTHIIEAAASIDSIENVFFKCMRTSTASQEFTYSYKLENGVCTERVGLKIIEDEGIVALLKANAE
ncbi:MutS-related protein [Mucilaginibacter terrae]|uniref:DNA mismatch repair protein MutS n=1 Tax=Mucilaginibacter terrae TaxID=1955052 RepID=A0ABU3GZ87_9SPHI|nr:hypothetical protein [Mucilaginibacter terrae]MDT3405076.1 DNA mismatch repair protein MutS [Mucilaginibacter terrae]